MDQAKRRDLDGLGMARSRWIMHHMRRRDPDEFWIRQGEIQEVFINSSNSTGDILEGDQLSEYEEKAQVG